MHDLHLMKECFLVRARDGVNMNQIAYRHPTHIYQSDSCPAGLGGYSHEGFAWHSYLDNDVKFRALNNLLEHLASIISPWINILTRPPMGRGLLAIHGRQHHLGGLDVKNEF
jgi:hypothetical protein